MSHAVSLLSQQVIEVESSDYSSACCIANCSSKDHTLRVDKNPCLVNISVTQRMKAPVYMYYRLTNFYQNHRRYVKSRSDVQLSGASETVSNLKDACEQQVYLQTEDGEDNTSAIISPCGLVSWSMFNDSLLLLNATGQPVPGVSEQGIAWQTDVDYKFKYAERAAQPSPCWSAESTSAVFHSSHLHSLMPPKLPASPIHTLIRPLTHMPPLAETTRTAPLASTSLVSLTSEV